MLALPEHNRHSVAKADALSLAIAKPHALLHAAAGDNSAHSRAHAAPHNATDPGAGAYPADLWPRAVPEFGRVQPDG
jgi:hypothetical protein